MKKKKRCMLAWLLTLAMVMTGVNLPEQLQKAQAAATSYELTVSEGDSPLSLAKNEYGDDYIADILFDIPDVIGNKSKVTAGNPQVEVKLSINSISNDTGTISAMIYAQDSSYNWNQSEASRISAGKEITLSYSLSDMTWNENNLAKLGVRFADDAAAGTRTISYSLVSAKVTVNSGGGSGGSQGAGGTTDDGIAADARIDASEFSVVATSQKDNEYWVEYTFRITNHTSGTATGIQAVLPTSGEPENFQTFESISAVYNSDVGGVIAYYPGQLAANASVTIAGKVGFNPKTVSVGTAYVRAVNCDPPSGKGTSAGTLDYELTGQVKDIPYSETPVGKHGKLHLAEVDGYGNAPVIVDENGNPFQMRGASTHGVQWFPEYVNKNAMQSLRDEWGVNLFRLACYITQYNGYTVGGQALIDQKIEEGVKAAKELGIYIIIDWHVHAENPHTEKAKAEEFFTKYATKYKDYDNVIFEICNEPTGVVWYDGSGSDLYSYCKDISSIIRNCGSDALIICGTNTWSQDVEEVAAMPLKHDGFDNILYTFHFYSGSHYDDKMKKVRMANQAGTPIFVTEFGICDASGNGGFDTANADAWIELCDSMNISYACWSLCNKDESASYLQTSCNKTSGGWIESDLATTGIWLVNTYRAHQAADNGEELPIKPSKNPTVSSTPSGGDQPTVSGNPSGGDQPTVSGSPSGGDQPTVSGSPSGGDQPTVSGSPSGGDQPTVSGNPSGGDQPTVSGNPSGGDQPTVSGSPSGGDQPTVSGSPSGGDQPTVSGNPSGGDQPTVSGNPSGGNQPTASGNPSGSNPSSTSSPLPTSSANPGGSNVGTGNGTGGTGTVPTISPTPTGGNNPDTTIHKKPTVKLKKKVLRVKKGKKVKIQIKKKMPGDKVKKYKIIGKKKIVKVTKKGVVKGRRKGRVTIKVIMKSGASARCKVIVK